MVGMMNSCWEGKQGISVNPNGVVLKVGLIKNCCVE